MLTSRTEYRADVFSPPASIRPSPQNLPRTLFYGRREFRFPRLTAEMGTMSLMRRMSPRSRRRFMQVNNTYTVPVAPLPLGQLLHLARFSSLPVLRQCSAGVRLVRRNRALWSRQRCYLLDCFRAIDRAEPLTPTVRL